MKIRKATTTDAGEIARLTAQLGYPGEVETIADRIGRINQDQDSLLLVAEASDSHERLKGWIQVSVSDTIESGFRAEILGLIVCEQFRKEGVGTRLALEVEKWAKQKGIDKMIVRSNLQRTDSHAFYPKIGYSKVKEQAIYRKIIKEDSNKSVDTTPASAPH